MRHSVASVLKEADVRVSILRGYRRERIEIKEIIKSSREKTVDGSHLTVVYKALISRFIMKQ